MFSRDRHLGATVVAVSTACERHGAFGPFDVVLSKDANTLVRHKHLLMHMAAAGTRIVLTTGIRDNDAPNPLPPWWRKAEFIDIDGHALTGPVTRDRYTRSLFSGPVAVQYACHNGATAVHAFGFEGILHDDDGNPHMSSRNQAMVMQQIVDAWSRVQFTFYGEMTYPVRGATIVQPQEAQ